MSLTQIVVLALVQGITEFLPISSSGHLIVTSRVLCWSDQGLMLDVAVHAGTLAAVIVYCWRDLAQVFAGLLHLFAPSRHPGARLAWLLVIGTIPVGIAGLLLKPYAETVFRDPTVIGWASIVFGVVLYLADRFGAERHGIERVGYGHALLIGASQILSLVPGTSRSGITMTAARALGFDRTAATRFSFLLAIPVSAAAGLLLGKDLAESGDLRLGLDVALAAGLSFLAALVVMALLMRWVKFATYTPFAVYRVVTGAALLYWAYALAEQAC
ncbi:MAG: undecaprenyl-diphosphate phosphatase [Alphaproteobacteria bacterium]|nr:undecaprenyl-diphosphate phosphatase [Alphaproteobacteria bacterium]